MKKCLRCDHTWNGSSWQCPDCLFQPAVVDGFLAFAPELGWDEGGYEAGFHQLLTTFEQNCFWFVGRNRLLVSAIKRFFPLAASFLEVGCGTGYVLGALREGLPELQVVAGELLLSGLRQVQARLPRTQLLQMDARRIPYREEFDVIGSFDVLEHVEHDEQALVQIHEALKPGGGCLVTVPQHRWLWSHQDVASHHKRRYSRGELRAKMESAGFRVVWMTSFVSLLLPVMAIARLWNEWGTKPEGRALQLPNLSATINGLFGRICDLERILIHSGVSLPVGGSLLAVGVKS